MDQRYHEISNTWQIFQKKSPNFPIFFQISNIKKYFLDFYPPTWGRHFLLNIPLPMTKFFSTMVLNSKFLLIKKLEFHFSDYRKVSKMTRFPLGKAHPPPLFVPKSGGGRRIAKSSQNRPKIPQDFEWLQNFEENFEII